MLLVYWLVVLLILDSGSLARKVKRKETYLHVPPPPQKQIKSHHSLHPPPHHPRSPPSAHIQLPAASQKAQHVSPYEYEDIHPDEFPPLNSAHPLPIARYETDFVTHGGSSNSFLIDNGLRSIAKGSADQANTAVANQNAAGKQAAYVAKSTLAQAATQAAGTAVAVLKGKELLLHRLEDQTAEAHKVVDSELSQLQQAKRSAKAAQYAAQQAINHVAVLTAALNNAQSASELAQKAASEAAAELASQLDMVAEAKSKLEQVEALLYSTRLDYEETKDAAEKATLSAQEAQINANDAALHANVELGGTIHLPNDSTEQKLSIEVVERGKRNGR